MTSSAWMDERPEHGIVLMRGTLLLCSCGTEIRLAGSDLSYHQRIQYDMLLDRHAKHRTRRKKGE